MISLPLNLLSVYLNCSIKSSYPLKFLIHGMIPQLYHFSKKEIP